MTLFNMDEEYAEGPGSFESFFMAHYRPVLASMCMALGDREAAADATAEAFTRAAAAWNRVGGLASPAGWTYRTALNHGRRIARRRSQEERLVIAAQMERQLEHSVPTSIGFWELLVDLPERQRTAVVLRFGADLTEVAIERNIASAQLPEGAPK